MISRIEYYKLCLSNAVSVDADIDGKLQYSIGTDENGMPLDADAEYVENCWTGDTVDDAMNDAYVSYTNIAKEK